MASAINWEDLLEKKYPSYTVEVNAFLDTAHVLKGTDISIQNIYQAIRNDDKVDANLKILYHECIYGTNKEVKTRIRNRVANFHRTLRLHPKIKNIDMMHAPDYANMGLAQMTKKLNDCKKKDAEVTKAMEQEAKRKRKNLPEKVDVKNEDNAPHDPEAVTEGKKPKIDTSDTGTDGDSNIDSAFDFFPNKAAKKKTIANPGESEKNEITKAQAEFASKGTDPTLQIEAGDFVFTDDEVDVESNKESVVDLRTYEKESSFKRKKLLAKTKDTEKKMLPTKSKSKAEEKFDVMMQEAEAQDAQASTSSASGQAQIDELMKSFDPVSASSTSEEDKEIMQEIKKATQSVSKNSVEQTAYFRALGKVNNLDMDKFRGEVQKELDSEAKKQADLSDQNMSTLNVEEDEVDSCAQSNIGKYSKNAAADSTLPLGTNHDVIPFQKFQVPPDDTETVTFSGTDTDDDILIPDNTPLYQNQEQDPEVQRLMFKEYFLE